jgi:hypothetical protein
MAPNGTKRPSPERIGACDLGALEGTRTPSLLIRDCAARIGNLGTWWLAWQDCPHRLAPSSSPRTASFNVGSLASKPALVDLRGRYSNSVKGCRSS